MLAYTNVAIATSYLFSQFSWGEYAPIPSKDGDACCIPLKANMQMIATFSLEGSKGRMCSVSVVELCGFPPTPFDF